MEDNDWQNVAMDVEEYLEAGAEMSDGLRQVIRLNLEVGHNDVKERKGIVKSLKNLLHGKEGTPFHKGNKSDLPAKVRVAVVQIGKMVYGASLEYMESNAIIRFITPRHKKSGGGIYGSAKEYAEANRKRVETTLKKNYRTGLWDGTLDGLMPLEEE